MAMSKEPLYSAYRAELKQEVMPKNFRSGSAVGAAIILGFVPVDLFFFPEHWIRFAGLRLSCSIAIASLYRWMRLRDPELGQIGVALLTGTTLLVMIWNTGGSNSLYAPGLVLLYVGMPVLMNITPTQALSICGILTICFSTYALASTTSIDSTQFGLSVVFLVSAGAVSGASAAALEAVRFSDFRQRREVEEARDRLASLDDAKTRFSANVHHELRTPLTLMLAPLEGLRAGDYGDVDQQVSKTFKTMHVNGQRLLKLINNLLDLAKLESDQFEIHKAPVEIETLLENIVIGARPMAERKGISLRDTVSEPPPTLNADSEALEKIIVNLLGNALKFTAEAGEIEVGAVAVEGGVEFFVRDSGIGLAPDQLERVFDRFAQVDGTATRKHEGTGIGLSLTQELVGLHDGRIWAESEGLGHGTTMRFFLPTGEADGEAEEALVVTAETGDVKGSAAADAAKAELADEPAAGNLSDSTSLSLVDLDRSIERWEDQQGDVAVAQTNEDDTRPEILVADDNTDMRELVSFILGRDFRVRTARNGREALDLLQDFLPDLIVSDIMMPEMSGIELCQAVKSDPRLARVPVMLVSSKAESEMKIEGLEMGADDYVTKPFHPRELLARARSHAALYAARRDLAVQNTALANALEDLRSAESQLIQSERLAAVGEIAAGIAHEVNNPVNYSLNAARALGGTVADVAAIVESITAINWDDPSEVSARGPKIREEVDYAGGASATEAVAELAEIVENGLVRTQKLVGDLRDFAKPSQPGSASDIDLAETVESTLGLVRAEIERSGTEIAWERPTDFPDALGRPAELSQVILNLVKNAAEAIGAGSGRITIEANENGAFVELSVADDGPGIPDEIRDQIFNPFFTTKEAGQGTGLGLAVCQKIAGAHGGELRYEDAPGGGARFVLSLPRADEADADPETKTGAPHEDAPAIPSA